LQGTYYHPERLDKAGHKHQCHYACDGKQPFAEYASINNLIAGNNGQGGGCAHQDGEYQSHYVYGPFPFCGFQAFAEIYKQKRGAKERRTHDEHHTQLQNGILIIWHKDDGAQYYVGKKTADDGFPCRIIVIHVLCIGLAFVTPSYYSNHGGYYYVGCSCCAEKQILK
jgi:hypothetical protein